MEIESQPKFEQIPETRVVLNFMRHGKKESEGTREENELRLTQLGRAQADELGKKLDPNILASVAWGAERKRTQETAWRVMLAKVLEEEMGKELAKEAATKAPEELTEELAAELAIEKDPKRASLEDIEQLVAKRMKAAGLGFASKMKVDSRLAYREDGPLGTELGEAYDADKFLEFTVEKSDERAIALGDEISSCYSRMAGNIAEIIQRHVKIADNFNRIASKPENAADLAKIGNELQKYQGTQQLVSESFIAKVLDKTRNREARDEFVKKVANGFKETQGFRLEIKNGADGQKISLRYDLGAGVETIEIDKKILDEIIKEKDELEKKVREALNKIN